MNVARVDCTSTKGRPLCSEYAVHGYPTLLYFPLDTDTYITYKGKRTLDAFESWIDSQLYIEINEENQIIKSKINESTADESGSELAAK